ncbi:COPPER-BINDING PERIPLASMIC PROTEIN [Salix viminalis]|uniref:COPPER-BINDING PERIPLASMIC PROTEIN n=1 Tax=Salix viminalis TaxID=40686 RepID=A0A9Q0U0F2_SALVM|nr:COPPER-BINDING PERIPLASMIC PROTEIN [Salix viminalis]
MAVDVCSEISSAGISPRISFSHDLNQPADAVSIEDHHHHRRLDSSLLDPDFDFCIGNSFVQELSSADELFSNGKILPVEIRKHFISSKGNNHQPDVFDLTTSASDHHRDYREEATEGVLVSESNSTGSAPNPPKQAMSSKESQKPKLHKQASVPSRKPSVPSSAPFYPYNTQQKPPLLRKCGSYGNGVRISPVLNITPPYISRGAVNPFGLGSLFCNGKAKRKKG